ncbi:MAG: hypothetical protein H6671_00265 [Anaerolineaceae bacterium]|nr:hypothetical protein [Anaerolineaceae bacterium]
MKQRLYLGIDGGGSNLRAVVVDESLTTVAQSRYQGSANPSSLGHGEASRRIRALIAQTCAELPLEAAVRGVGIGVAGAAASHSADWLVEVVEGALPDAVVFPSSDFEIALVGAHGAREGILVLAGTGSVAFGVNAAGQTAQAGGWGYLIGDEGSGYWIGARALTAVTQAADGQAGPTLLSNRLLNVLNLRSAMDVIPWLYRDTPAVVPTVAGLARHVLELAGSDSIAAGILDSAAAALVHLSTAVRMRLGDMTLPIAFAGGLLSEPNPLSQLLCEELNLTAFPTARYSPVVGAALLAKLMIEGK